MKKVSSIYLIVLFAVVCAVPAFGQSAAQVERELAAALNDIRNYSTYGAGYDEKNLKTAQAAFQEKLLRFTKSVATLNYNFTDLGPQMTIATSEDGKLRIFSWDLMDGGTMRHFARLYQYQSVDGNVYSKTEELPEEGMGPGFVTDIFAFETKDGKVYIAASTFIASSRLNSQSAELYKIEGSSLNENVKLIKTRSGITNALRFEYDNFSVIVQEKPRYKLITFDSKTSTLRIPIVVKDKDYPDGRVTDKFITYKFDGKYFVKVS